MTARPFLVVLLLSIGACLPSRSKTLVSDASPEAPATLSLHPPSSNAIQLPDVLPLPDAGRRPSDLDYASPSSHCDEPYCLASTVDLLAGEAPTDAYPAGTVVVADTAPIADGGRGRTLTITEWDLARAAAVRHFEADGDADQDPWLARGADGIYLVTGTRGGVFGASVGIFSQELGLLSQGRDTQVCTWGDTTLTLRAEGDLLALVGNGFCEAKVGGAFRVSTYGPDGKLLGAYTVGQTDGGPGDGLISQRLRENLAILDGHVYVALLDAHGGISIAKLSRTSKLEHRWPVAHAPAKDVRLTSAGGALTLWIDAEPPRVFSADMAPLDAARAAPRLRSAGASGSGTSP